MKPLSLIAAIVGYANACVASTVASLDDIQLWAGAGANRAALAIDFDGAAAGDEALVWGYRWDGVATGEQMLRDVVAADPRLFAKIGTQGQLGLAVYGLGYDQDGDGAFALDDGTSFDMDGVATSDPSDGAEALDAEDRYVEGWEDGYWHYGLAAAPTGAPVWTTASAGPSTRPLADGDWDSYAFAVTLNFDEFAQNLIAAAAEPQPGDFNGDSVVDAADYTVWRDTLGQPGGATPSDYDLWASAYAASGSSSAISTAAVPEPTGVVLLVIGFLQMFCNQPRRVS